METLEFSLLNDHQRDFPLCARPYREIAANLGVDETRVLRALAALQARGVVSRVGATFAPGRIGAATLAALRVPPGRIAEVAAMVSGYPEVNHNYERDHAYNLWFVVTAPASPRVAEVVADIERRAHCGPALNLPMVQAFHVDLGFDLTRSHEPLPVRQPSRADPYTLAPEAAQVIAALQHGLAIATRPYAELAARVRSDESRVITTLATLARDRVISRLGVIVRHRAVGYLANAMTVWDVPESDLGRAGTRLAAAPGVALCYERRRALPGWPYNLYCMLYGTERGEVVRRTADLSAECGLARCRRELLFSGRCFGQRAARYVAEESHGRDRPAYRELAPG